MKQITLDTFRKEVMQNPKPVFLEFHGSFCTACTMMDPLISQAEQKYGSEMDFFIADGDHEEMLNTVLNVRNLPAVFLFYKGHTYLHHEGFMPEVNLNNALDDFILQVQKKQNAQ